MTDNLVKRLKTWPASSSTWALLGEAADRIEELEKACKDIAALSGTDEDKAFMSHLISKAAYAGMIYPDGTYGFTPPQLTEYKE